MTEEVKEILAARHQYFSLLISGLETWQKVDDAEDAKIKAILKSLKAYKKHVEKELKGE